MRFLVKLALSFFSILIVHRNVLPLQQAAAIVNSGLLLMAVMGIMFPAVLHFTHSELHFGKSELSLSRFSSCIMLVAYASYLFFQLRSQQNLDGPLDGVSFLNSFVWYLEQRKIYMTLSSSTLD